MIEEGDLHARAGAGPQHIWITVPPGVSSSRSATQSAGRDRSKRACPERPLDAG